MLAISKKEARLLGWGGGALSVILQDLPTARVTGIAGRGRECRTLLRML